MGDGRRRVRGGRAVYGAAIGILMLEARFPRIPGDMGNALTWPFPVHYRVVKGASPERVVRERARGLLEAFVEAGRELVALGCDGITTNCGFLAVFQRELASALGVPVAASSLLQAAAIQALLPPGRRVGILTVSAADLTAEHLRAAGVPEGTPVVGTEGGREFTRVILGDRDELDPEAAEADLLAAAERLVTAHPEVGAILLECTNMCPYARAIAEHTGLPVFDMVGFVRWFQEGLRPRRFASPFETDGRARRA
ncbi:MAG: aspartate/glutamate racemase family protein [Geminicoccaceae bacterium]|nr:aspartate/glutamate racemase family protein [Geminicoccaceae bacterium]MCS7268248.1 aspartate/glutamate racemase family protein [Geminicoccaceae bacterium]MDW8126033.1 aspartate/glutamate racemase family protein [Geminicoccaceae bacterium]MDW8340887.1 aspartate/glutamate racemase family protein [Geminicoccaceae bacterium]